MGVNPGTVNPVSTKDYLVEKMKRTIIAAGIVLAAAILGLSIRRC
ncbi:hypothetical protein ACFLX4_02810 [Chloroflexota bacterium]